MHLKKRLALSIGDLDACAIDLPASNQETMLRADSSLKKKTFLVDPVQGRNPGPFSLVYLVIIIQLSFLHPSIKYGTSIVNDKWKVEM